MTHAPDLPELFERLFQGRSLAGLGDDELLARIVERGEAAETAFEVLIERHGPMVLGVCRRGLGDRDRADDAFQATFLVLFRCLHRVAGRRSIAPWLYETARRITAKARVAEARRLTRERRYAERRSEATDFPEMTVELQELLDLELSRLPTKHREPLILCHLQGLTHESAAALLGWPVGTVRVRMARGREQLKRRLLQRGIAPAVLTRLTMLDDSVFREVPVALRRIAVQAIGRPESISVGVRELAKFGGRGLAASGKPAVAALVAAAAAVGIGAASIGYRASSTRAISQAPQEDLARVGLPDRALLRLGDPRFNAGSIVNMVDWSKAGDRVAVSGQFGSVGVWSFPEGRSLAELKVSDRGGAVSAFAQGTGVIASATGAPSELRVWNAAGKTLLHRVYPRRDRAQIQNIALDWDGTRMAVVVSRNPDGFQQAWSLELQEIGDAGPPKSLSIDLVYPLDLRLAPNGETLALACRCRDTDPKAKGPNAHRGALKLFDWKTGRETRSLDAGGFEFRCVTFLPDGKRFAAGVSDATVRIYDLESGVESLPRIGAEQADEVPPGRAAGEEEERPFEKGSGRKPAVADSKIGVLGVARTLTASPDGRLLAWGESGSNYVSPLNSASIHIWDLQARRETHRIPAHQQWVETLAFSPDSKLLASGGVEELVRFWDVGSGREALPRIGHRSFVRALAVAPDGKTAFTGGYDGSVRRWDLATGKEIALIARLSNPIRLLETTPDGKRLLADLQSGRDAGLHEIDLSTGKATRIIRSLSPRGNLWAARLTGDGKRLVSAAGVIDFESGEPLYRLEPTGSLELPGGGFDLALFSSTTRDNRLLVFGRDGVRYHDLATGKPGRVAIRDRVHSSPAILSANGGYLICSGASKEYPWLDIDPPIRMYELASGGLALVLGDDDLPPMSALAATRDGRLLFSGTGRTRLADSYPIRIWDLVSGKLLRLLEGHRNIINQLQLFEDERKLISASDDGTVLVWDISGLAPALEQPEIDDDALRRLWDRLGTTDAEGAYKASWALTRPDAVAWLGKNIEPVLAPDPDRLAKLIKAASLAETGAALSARYELMNLGSVVAADVRKTLADHPTDAFREFAAEFHERLEGPIRSTRLLQSLRAIAVLERIGNVPARRLLEKLASGADLASETQEARFALERLAR